MKDLYRRLHIEIASYANHPDAIRQAIAMLEDDKATARAASHILLVDQRKRVYDRTHKSLATIGQLRANLGLTCGEGWRASNATDFEFPANAATTELERLRETKQAKFLRDNIRGLTTAGLGALLLVAIFVLVVGLGDNGSPDRPAASELPIAASIDSRVSAERPLSDSAIVVDPPSPFAGIERRGEVAELIPEVQPQLLPKTGDSRLSMEYIFAEKQAPLKIVTPARAGHHLVKFTDSRTEKEVARFFIREGETLEAKMPLGSFNLRYAYGHAWYGHENLFGHGKTKCARSDDSFDFYIEGDRIAGNEIQLIKQLNGNLETEPIDIDEF